MRRLHRQQGQLSLSNPGQEILVDERPPDNNSLLSCCAKETDTWTHFSSSDTGSEPRICLAVRATTPGVTKQSHKGCCSSMCRSLYAVEGHSAKTLGEMVTIPPVASSKMMREQCKVSVKLTRRINLPYAPPCRWNRMMCPVSHELNVQPLHPPLHQGMQLM